MKCIFTIDVEDWFHILDLPSTPDISQWEGLPSRVEANFVRLLDVLDETNSQATCFFLGWVAERFPHLVREAITRGHEVASHGYRHQLAFRMTPQEFLEDAMISKKMIEDVGGQAVWGYRASGFSVTKDTPWFFGKLIEAGYRYDSSVFPAPRGHGGLQNACYLPYCLGPKSEFVEFPASVEPIVGKPICFFGGGYLRLFPYSLVKTMTKRILSKGRPVIFYIHPREIDPKHPRLSMGWKRKFKSYVNIASTEGKIRRLLSEFEMVTFREFLATEIVKLPVDRQTHSHEIGVLSNSESVTYTELGQT